MSQNKNRKLLQVSSGLDQKIGGPYTVIWAAHNFLDNYFDRKLLVFGKSSKMTDKIISIPTLFNNRYGLSFKSLKMSRLKKIRDVDVLLIHGFYLFSTLIALKLFQTPHIFLMPHGSLEQYQEKKRRLRKYFFRKIIQHLLGDRKIHFLLGSDSERASVFKLYPDAQMSIVGLGVEIDKKAFKPSSKLNSPVRLFCLSRISEKKRIDLCLRALQEVNKFQIECTLEIIGSGDKALEKELRSLARELGIEEEVTFSGFLDGNRKRESIRNSDIFLLPSENENFAVAVAESIVEGKPVIVSRFVAMHEFVNLYRTGVTVDSLEFPELIKAIHNVIQNYDEFQRNCVDSAHLLSWEEIQKNWIRVLTK